MLEVICVPAIMAVVFLLIEVYKKWIAKGKEKWLNFIPIIAGALGLVLGVIFYFAAPTIMIADNVWSALFIGLCSGLSATGCNQIFKQLKKYGVEIKISGQGISQSNVVSK